MLIVQDQELDIQIIVGLIKLLPCRLPDRDDGSGGKDESTPALWLKVFAKVRRWGRNSTA